MKGGVLWRMMPRKKKAVDREIEGEYYVSSLNLNDFPSAHTAALKARRKKAQEKNDIAEEAKLCNAIGAVYTRKGMFTVRGDKQRWYSSCHLTPREPRAGPALPPHGAAPLRGHWRCSGDGHCASQGGRVPLRAEGLRAGH